MAASIPRVEHSSAGLQVSFELSLPVARPSRLRATVDSRLISTQSFRYNRIAIKTYLAARQRLLELRASTVRKRNA